MEITRSWVLRLRISTSENAMESCYLLKKTARSSRARVHLLKAVRNYTRREE